MDINASFGTTLPNGDIIGIDYGIGSTNATATSPVLSATLYESNPGSFAVTGTVVAAVQVVFGEMPSQITLASDRESQINFGYSNNGEAQPVLVPGTTFTCTIFDGKTLIGSASAPVNGSTNGGVTNFETGCQGIYPNNASGASSTGHAFVNMPATYNSNDTYTFVISH